MEMKTDFFHVKILAKYVVVLVLQSSEVYQIFYFPRVLLLSITYIYTPIPISC